MDVRFPVWIDKLPTNDREAARVRFLLKLAALHYSPRGTVRELSAGLGYTSDSLVQYNKISGELAVKLENLLGRDAFPRELFRPDLFITVES